MKNDDIVLSCEGLHHWFGPKHVLHEINLSIVRGQIVALVGPSGCGKSTLLRSIVGTHPPRRGSVIIHQKEGDTIVSHPVTRPGRDRGIVYQRYTLFPNLTAIQNVAFGRMLDETTIPFRLFKVQQWRKLRFEHLKEAAALLDKLGLGHARDNYPQELSGGMRQRVAIAQALIMKPAILLLDEPFGALDESTREDLQRMLLSLYKENIDAAERNESPPYTILMVTHELNEALFVSDRVLGLSQYWDWKGAGHKEFPGATIVYDNSAPVFHPQAEREYQAFSTRKEEILRATFEPEVCQAHDEFLRFWKAAGDGRVTGILRS